MKAKYNHRWREWQFAAPRMPLDVEWVTVRYDKRGFTGYSAIPIRCPQMNLDYKADKGGGEIYEGYRRADSPWRSAVLPAARFAKLRRLLGLGD